MLEGAQYCTASTIHSHSKIILQWMHVPGASQESRSQSKNTCPADKVYGGQGSRRCMPGTGDMKPHWWQQVHGWVPAAKIYYYDGIKCR